MKRTKREIIRMISHLTETHSKRVVFMDNGSVGGLVVLLRLFDVLPFEEAIYDTYEKEKKVTEIERSFLGWKFKDKDVENVSDWVIRKANVFKNKLIDDLEKGELEWN